MPRTVPEIAEQTSESDIEILTGLIIDLDAITLDSFTANPQRVPPCAGPPVELKWQISEDYSVVADDPALRAALKAVNFQLFPIALDVQESGQTEVRPAATTTYRIHALYGRAMLSLEPSLTVVVDESSCPTYSITEDLLRSVAQQGAEDFVRSYNTANKDELRLTGAVGLQIRSDGVDMHLSLLRPGVIDVTIDVDATFWLYPKKCGVGVVSSSFSVDADLPWELYLVDPVAVAVIEFILDVVIGNELRPALVKGFEELFSMFVPEGRCVCRISPQTGTLTVIACPILAKNGGSSNA